jgi:ATP-dependent protease ClpP protease subunit
VKPHPDPHRPVFQHDAKPIHRRQGWEVAVSGDLSEKQSDLVEELLKLEPGSWGTLYFDSPGGNVYAGISLASLIRLRRLKATAVVLGECSSAAILPFAACPERYVLPFSTLFFHPVRSSSEEDVQLEEAAEWARHFAIIEEEMDQLLANFFGRTYEDVRGWSRPGRFFTGREVANLGLARLLEMNGKDLREQIAALRKLTPAATNNG